MAKYSVTYKCGHTGTVELFGKTSDREWRLEQLAKGNCPDCEEAEMRKVIAEFNAERELPALSGTDRQVAWADKLRMYAIRMIEDEYGRMSDGSPDKEPMSQVLQEMYSITDARFWIDHRDDGKYVVVSTVAKRIKTKEGPKPAGHDPEYLARLDDVEQRKDGVARIKISGEHISFEYTKDDSFRKVLKEHDCRWSGTEWVKKTAPKKGTAEDIAAEIGRHLLSEGFTVSFPSVAVKEKAVNMTYEPERTRWIQKEDDTHVFLSWRDRNDTLYHAAKSLKSARYKDGVFIVSAEYYDCIEDFAEAHGFWISPKAKDVLAQCRAKVTGADQVHLTEPEKPEEPETDLLAELTEED